MAYLRGLTNDILTQSSVYHCKSVILGIHWIRRFATFGYENMSIKCPIVL